MEIVEAARSIAVNNGSIAVNNGSIAVPRNNGVTTISINI
jgi:hypothetical protein